MEFNLNLKIGGEEIQAAVRVPDGPIRPVELLPVLQSFDNAVIDAAIEAVGREGKTVSCRAGCGACCRQVVPISRTEAFYLADVVANLPQEHRFRVLQRFRQAYETLDAGGLLERLRAAPQLTDADEQGQLARDYFRAQVACPFLEEESCGIHPDRPLSCREYLVTTPAAHCSDPEANEIEKVPHVQLTKILFHFDDGEGRGALHFLPLIVALEWAVAHAPDPQPTLPGDWMFQNFLDRLGEQGKVKL
jgi:Fe-S-cluster containining protein